MGTYELKREEGNESRVSNSATPYQRFTDDERQSCRLDWAKSSYARWIQLPLYSWLTPLLSLGNKSTLVDTDLPDLSPHDQCAFSLDKANQFSSNWPGTWQLFRGVFLKSFRLSIFLVLPLVIAQMAQPMLIRQIVLYLKDSSKSPVYLGYLYAVALCISAILQAVTHQHIYFLNARIGMRVRTTLSSALYKHLLTVNTATLHETTAAQVINLVANDAGKFEEMSLFLHALLLAPLEVCIAFGLIWWHIGVPTLFGYAVLILMAPLQFFLSRQFGRYRRLTLACVDKRIQTINELVSGCQIIKMYNWEKAMERQVRKTRQRELSNIYRASCLRALNVALSFSTLPLVSLAVFGGGWLMGHQLLPENIFATLAFFAMIRVPLTVTMPQVIEKFSEARVSARRIDRFMNLDVLSSSREISEDKNLDYVVWMEDASFSWKKSPSLHSLNLKISKGHLVGVKGNVGAGKSTLLAAILGEIPLISGRLRLSVHSISYASQSAWIFADTIRANILFGRPMCEDRYLNVIKACCLDTDLRSFGEVGDLLMIGDRGVNLSGGQKARVSLARALYADADLYLLDDPLAAVDPSVAESIYEQCIGPRSLLSNKTRILVTHQTQFLTEVDQSIHLKEGRIDEVSIEEHSTPAQQNTTAPTKDKKPKWTLDKVTQDEHSIVTNEATGDGAIQWHIWLKLFTSPPLRYFGLFLIVILMLGNEAIFDFNNRWLAQWSGKEKDEQRSSIYAKVYLAGTLSTFILALIRVGTIYYIMLHGSTYFHNRMLKGILYTSLRFFESNPSGRILNRASKDQQALDESLPTALIDTMQYLLATLGSIVIIGMTNPWVLLILIPLVPSVVWLRRFYLRSSRQVKRLESVTRSPVYNWFASSLDGLPNIRTFNRQKDFLNMFIERVDANTRAYFIFISTSRWFGLRLDLMASSLTLLTAVLAVALRQQIDPATAALSINYCINLTGMFQWAMRQSAEAENQMTSAERIYEYSQLEPENRPYSRTTDNFIQPAKDWPSQGVIEFKNYTFRYRPDLETVLKQINLRIESQEKIGVIGRTGLISNRCTLKILFVDLGAGKSSLLQALFRLVDSKSIEGTIFIDDVDISRLSLDDLRSRLSVIPQVPILFSGTLRYNIDPFEQYSDEQCLAALEAVQLKQLITNHPGGLRMLVAESGTNLSVGERQLICVARAILRKSRILLIDEATANVDDTTDQMIQSVIADKFHDRTILTIAHRLDTVANSDRILMLQQGEVAYFGVSDDCQKLFRSTSFT